MYPELFRFDDIVDLFVEVALVARRGAADPDTDFYVTPYAS